MKVLIVKTSSMGDILQTLPALTDAKKSIPNICFDWVIEENFSQIPSWHSSVRNIIPIQIRLWCKNFFLYSSLLSLFKFIKKLRNKKYNLIIDAQGLIKSAALITFFARGEKHGPNYHSSKEFISSFFYDKKHNIKKGHAIERNRKLFACSLGYNISSNIDYGIFEKFIPISKKENYLIFLHSTTCPKKMWPEPYWKTLIKIANSLYGYQIQLFWGNEQERERCFRLASSSDGIKVFSFLSIEQIANNMLHSTGIISVDTGLSHLAAALNCLNLTLYGPTDPKLVGRFGMNQFSLRASKGNMENLTPKQVWRTFRSMIKNSN